MQKLYPRMRLLEISEKRKFTRAETAFVGYVADLKLNHLLLDVRERLGIHFSGFTQISEVKLWLQLESDEMLLRKLNAFVEKMLKEKGLPEDFVSPMMDYVLTGFRFNIFFDNKEQSSFFCRVVDRNETGPRRSINVTIYEDATAKDVQELLNKFKPLTGSARRVRSPDYHNRAEVIRYYKSKSKDELKKILELYDVEALIQLNKVDLVKHALKNRHNIKVTTDLINQISLEG